MILTPSLSPDKDPRLKHDTDWVSLALGALKDALMRVPILSMWQEENTVENLHIDTILKVKHSGKTWSIWLNVKLQAPPSQTRDIAKYLSSQALNQKLPTYPVLAASWISPESRKICEAAGIGYLDLAGNCRLSFGSIYIERTGFENPKAEKRELKSLFGSKSARVLRLLLDNPKRALKITDMVELVDVSLGQASNIRKTLLAQEWAIESKNGIQLRESQKLLNAWADKYNPPKHQRYQCYTLLHGKALEVALDKTMQETLSKQFPRVGLALASSSAAHYWAPYLQSPVTHLYALDLQPILPILQAKPVDKGGNLIIDVIEDAGYFLDVREVKKGLWATSPVQTYLDLNYGGERNREAAEHLLKHVILPQWNKA